MSDEKLENHEAMHTLQQEHEDEELSSDTPSPEENDDQDSLEVDQGLRSEEIHPEDAEIRAESDTSVGSDTPAESDDGVHGVEHETEDTAPAPASDAPGHAAPVIEDPASTKHWYIIHAYSGFEQKVAESLRTRAQAFGFAGRLGQILIPTEEVVELRNGKKVTSKRLLYPGYVLVEMEMDDELWHAVKNTPR